MAEIDQPRVLKCVSFHVFSSCEHGGGHFELDGIGTASFEGASPRLVDLRVHPGLTGGEFQ